MKNYDKNEESSSLEYLGTNNLYAWTMSQPLPVDGFKFVKNLSNIDEEDSDKEYIVEVDVEYPKNFHDLHIELPFLPERMKIDKCSKLVCNLHDKKAMLFI